MPIRIYDEDDYLTIATKIYESFEVGQNCSIKGVVIDEALQKVYTKGELVLKEISRRDSVDNIRFHGAKQIRKQRRPANTIGGYTMQKQFRWTELRTNQDAKYTIWRIQ